MTAKGRMTWHLTWHLASAAMGAMMLAVVLPAPGSAQQSDPSARAAKSEQGVTAHPAPKPDKPAARTGAVQNAKVSAKTNAK